MFEMFTRPVQILEERHAPRVQAMGDRWDDEAFDAAMADNPRRSDYLEWMAGRAPQLVAEARQREASLLERVARLKAAA